MSQLNSISKNTIQGITTVVWLAVTLGALCAQAGSAFDHVNGKENLSAMKHAYFGAVLSNVQRKKIIAAAKEECGGRYEGTEIDVIELSHETVLGKQVINTPTPGTYKLKIKASTDAKWMVVENIKCSVHGGHNKSVLHARLMSGTEKLDVNYSYVADEQVGDETVTNITRTFSAGSAALASQYKTPYGTAIP